jgi:hypothetical protein
MNPRFHFIIGSVSALAVAGSMLLPMAASGQAAQGEDVQILTRGPVHEAFAESVSFDPVAGVIISGPVPEAIEELPPEQQLEGDNVTWIPGYWAWDDDQNDFIWISGIWRNLPPGRQWVPGYWSELDGGQSQWTSGYWADATETEVSYVATAPPRSIDSGPNIEAPSSNHSWVPGNWFWVDTRYAWRPGYWVPQRTDWTWVPSRYNWTRRGYVHVDGYWDYAVARRGVLFAPVYFNRHVYSQPDYYYTPSIVVGLSVFSNHLFVRPSCGHYYFGDYYAPRYRDSGYYSSFSWHSGRRGYDPIYAYDRWSHRDDRGWERRRSDDYNYFRDNENARPPRTWAAMRDYREDRFNDGRNRSYATSLATYSQDSKSGQRFRALDDGRRKQIVSQRQEMRKFGQERRQLESRRSATGDRAKAGSSREKIVRSPIAGREVGKFAKNEAPPKRPEARADKSKMVAPTKNKVKDGVARKDSPANPRNTERGETTRDDKNRADGKAAAPGKRKESPANPRSAERGVTPRDDEARANGKRAAPGQNRDAKDGNAGKADQPKSAAEKDTNKVKTPERESKPKADLRPTPGTKSQIAPKREVQPKPQRREMQPNKVEPRATPERKPQVAAKRESQLTPQVRKAAQPKAQPRPERKQQAAPKREAPRQQARPASQPKGKPKQQANPQRENPAENKKGTSAPGESLDKKNKKSKE